MKIIDCARLALLAAVRGFGLFVDACKDLLDMAMPYSADQAVTPSVLSDWLNRYRVEPVSGVVSISDVKILNIPSVSSNCNNVVVEIEQLGEPLLPQSLFIKLPMASLSTRWFFSVIGSWQLESLFFKSVAHTVPLRTPITYATKSQGSRFFLIQENLHQDPDVQLFTNPDMLQGPSLDLVRRCLDAFARLHACHYDLSASEREAILPMQYHPFLSPRMRLVSQTLNAMALKPCMTKLPGIIPAEVADAYQLTQQHWDQLLEYWFSGPLSMLHGDSHLGNFFVSGNEMGMLDWQAVHWGKGVRDVQYFLIDSLPANVLAEHERDLVEFYVAKRADYGTAIDPEQTWQDYRSFSYHTLMTIVVSIGFGALNEEQDLLMQEILNRAIAAVERVDYGGWLDNFLAVP